MVTGLNSTSQPRMLKAHATSSSMLTTRASAPCLAISARSFPSLLGTSSPAYSKGWTRTAPRGSAGRAAPHTLSTKFPGFTATSSRPPPVSVSASFFAFSAVWSMGSIPTRPAGPRCSFRKSPMSGVSARPARISCHSGPSSCSACRKYRPSVHSSAESLVTTAVPALPVNPERNSRRA